MVDITAVQALSVKEKKDLRLERFNPKPTGLGGLNPPASMNTIEALQRKKDEEERRLARAHKFNLITPEVVDIKRQ